jgi:hypothetical protein
MGHQYVKKSVLEFNGMFGGWIASELEMSSQTANRFMSVARLCDPKCSV